ncbi:MDR family MFS transporter [Sporobolomyces salmoneus]|uniref:MDR family MFS transporter n=1 Tax=Sporobolomyces salmoneus TaxID=183962 RepID=UPI00316E7308
MSPSNPIEVDRGLPPQLQGDDSSHRPGLAELELAAVKSRTRRNSGTDSTVVGTPAAERTGGSINVEEKIEKDTLSNDVGTDESGKKPLTGFRLVLLMVAMLLVEFLVGLEQTIVVSATPSISNEFGALQDIGWYGSAYLLTCCSFQPLFGRSFQFFPQKYAFLTAFSIFELGTLICALSHNSPTFIAGRAVQGLGYAGLFLGILSIAANTLPMRLQAIFTSLMNACYGSGTVIGPLIGGALSEIGWRWCFWICLIPAPLVLAAIFFFCDPPRIPQQHSVKERLRQMDWIGAALLIGSTICLLLALQRGGISDAWDSSTIIGLLVGFVLIFTVFIAFEAWLGERSSISIRLLRSRDLGILSLGPQFACGVTFYSLIYFIPIYFQTVQGSSPLRSGVQMLPIILLNMSSGIAAGWVCSRFGNWHYPMAYGLALTSIGAGLFSTMTDSTSTGKWVGFQMIAGSGMGALYMLSFIGSQVLAKPEDRPKASALVCFFQIWSATVAVSASEAIYQNSFKNGVSQIPGIDAVRVVESGVSEFRNVVEAQYLPAVIRVAEDSLFKVFLTSAVIAAYGFIAFFGIRWKKIEKEPKKIESKTDEESVQG